MAEGSENKGMLGESFGQKPPPLYEMIRNILREYPSGQIFKEVIQNADDAHATEVKFILDCRHRHTLPHTLDGTCLSNEQKDQYSGPALLSYNNAPFKKEDWESIQSLYQSGKAKNPHKVGKFGIGFNSVYHVTDIPVILSQDYCGFLEPQERVWRDADSGRGESGRGFYLNELSTKCTEVLDQFHNVCGFSKTHLQFANQTLLRFPLRSKASKLSNDIYTIDKLHELLEPLKEEVQYLLVYLRSVCSIEISQIETNGSITSIFKVSIDQSEIACQRQQLVQSVETTFSGTSPYSVRKVLTDVYHFNITLEINGSCNSQYNWLVVNEVGSKDGEVLQLAEKLHVLPWVGTAIEMSQQPSEATAGRIFCVLPLPVEDRAPFCVHVNGTFAVSSNRRSLKWEVQERRGDEEGTWNKLLVSKCLPSCYMKLVSELMALNKRDPTLVYSCWPDIQQVSYTQWSGLLQPFYTSSLQCNTVVHTPLEDGKWISVKNSVFITNIPQPVNDALLQCNVSLVEVNDNCTTALRQYYNGSRQVLLPSIARSHLKRNPISYVHMSRENKIAILQYCLSDRAYNDVIGLQLLPLADGTFGQFQRKSNSYYSSIPEVYLCTSSNPCTLLPGIENRLVSVYNDDTMLQSVLQSVAQSSHTQLTLLGVTQVANLVSQCNTSSWSQQQMTHFWQWLGGESLNEFKGKPIVPVKLPNGSSTVVSLNKQAGVVYIHLNTYNVSQEVVSALKKCEVKFADSHECNYLVHSQLRQYLYQYEQPNDVLDALQSVIILSHVTFTASESVAIQEFFSSVDFYSVSRLNTICTLPVFTSLQKGSSTRYSINSMKTSYCNNRAIAMSDKYDFRTDLLPSNPLIINTQENNFKLVSKLKTGVEFLTGTEFLQRVAFPLIQKSQFTDVVPFMMSILENFYIFQIASSQFSNILQSLPFVETQSGTLIAPCNLYDPENEILTELFMGGYNKFPSSQFYPHLPILRRCGLQTSVGASVILDIVTSIQQSLSYPSNDIDCVQSTSYTRAVAVLKYLSLNTSLLDAKVNYTHSYCPLQQALANLARQCCWLPVASSQPDNYPSCLEWKGSDYKYGLASTKYTPLVFLSQNENINSSQLPMIVGSQAVFIENVPNSLATSLSYTRNDLINGIVSHFQQVIENEIEIPEDLLCCISIQTYKYLSNDIELCRKNVLTGKWILIENLSTFVDSNQVAIDAHPSFRTSLEPFIYTIPSNLRKYSNLLIKCGVNQQITISQITSVLNLIKSCSELTITCEDAWSIIRAILEWLVADETRLNEAGDVLVPVERDDSNDWPLLLPSSQVAYTDNDMLREIAKGSVEEKYYLVHPRVSHLSSSLGLTPLSDRLDITEDVFEDAGQHEPLVTRLANILREYKDGLTIIKEMIQNADDAGATEVNILYDNRTHPTQNLLFKGMAQCHGPALIVHNNTTFTEEDFENITKLAGATKANQPLKIGKFGVGFCSVYHITDVPSFVSGEWLYIFDPTLQYLKGVVRNENRPGKKIKYQSKFLSNSKQLLPYENLFNFTSFSTYNGTMFRLPFRTNVSQISSTIYNDYMISQMKEALQSNGSQLLLFLQNVKKITFSSIKSNSNEVSIECSLPSGSIGRCITTSIDDTSNDEEHWLVCTQTDSIRVATGDDRIATASVACQLDDFDDCLPINGAVFCYLPLAVPNTGLPVHVSANFAVMSNRSGIWTDASSGGVASDSREAWNQQLIETVIPIAYCNLLLKLKEVALHAGVTSYDFYSLWPLEANLQMRHPWDRLITALYNLISQESLFHSVSTSQWLTLAQSQFLPSSLFHGYISMDTLTDTVTKLQLPVVSLPSQYFEQLQKVGPKVSVITEYQFAETFLSNINLFTDSIEARNNVLFGILKKVGFELSSVSGTTPLFNFLNKYQCIPCSPTGNDLQFAQNLVDPNEFKQMFDPEDGKFPLDKFYNDVLIYQMILKLGLMCDNLPWELIADSAETVKMLFVNNQEKALKRIETVIKSISEKQDTSSLPIKLKQIPFLPVLQKPEKFILPWKGDRCHLLPSCEVISFTNLRKCGVLVGSQKAIVNTYQISTGGCGPIPKNVLIALDISTRPSFNDVLNHFEFLVNSFQSSMCQDSDKREHIEETCRCVYEYFEKSLNHLAKSKASPLPVFKYNRQTSLEEVDDSTVSKEALEVYKDRPFIWTGQEFVCPCDIAKNWSQDKGPFLYKIPSMLSERKSLLECLQVVEKFSFQKLINTLSKIRIQNNQVKEDYRPTIDSIILELNSVTLPENLTTYCDIILSDDNYSLYPSNLLVYNDASWLPADSDQKYVHPMLTKEKAEKLGVTLTSSKFLDQYKSSEQNFQGLPFGQREELTQRIKNILRDYPLDVTFLKELLQNADDAKATKMTVILDKRQHGTERLLSERWAELQGPAVLVWNDKDFSDKDIVGIQRLGLGSKRDDHESIGQFGIGFNVVYHLTDCPSFITHGGSTLCVFDPHCKYVPGSSLQCPGMRYNVNDEFWYRMFDLKSPYLQHIKLPGQPEGLDNSGVLFRFPLRCTKEQVIDSELVSDEVDTEPLTAESMEAKLNDWVRVIKDSLIFLNHIIQFEFYVIDDSNKFKCKKSYRVHITKESYQKRVSLKQCMSTFKQTREPKLVTYPLTIESTVPSVTKQNWLVQQGVGDVQDPSNKYWPFINQTLPKHGIATQLEDREKFSGKVFCFLPLPVYTRLPVHINGQFALNSNRRSLWTSSTDKPDDRTKWNESLIKAIASSYVTFLQNAKQFCISSDGYRDKDDLYDAVNAYYSFFPFWNPPFTFKSKKDKGNESQTPHDQSSVHYRSSPTMIKKEDWKGICTLVFNLLWSSNATVLSSEKREHNSCSDVIWHVQWHVLHNDDDQFRQAYFQHSLADKELRTILRSLGMILTCAPRQLNEHLKDQEPALISTKSVYCHYTSFHSDILSQSGSPPFHIEETPFKSVENFCLFLKYLLIQQLEKNGTFVCKFLSSPTNTPLLLTADRELRNFEQPSRLVLCSKYSELFQNSSRHFLHPTVLQKCPHMCPSYFSSTTEVNYSIVEMILNENYSPKLRSVLEVSNADASIISIEALKGLWNCLSDDPYFKNHQDSIVKKWALIPSRSGILYSADSPILPILHTSVDYFVNVFDILTSFGLPIFNSAVFQDYLAKKYCIDFSSSPSKVLRALYHLHHTKQVLNKLINPQETVRVLFKYFSRIHFKQESVSLDHIKSLPLFKNANGWYTNIEDKKIYQWPSTGFCKAGYDKWAPSERIVFLDIDGEWRTVLDCDIYTLGGQLLNDREVYSNVVFTSFSQLTSQERYDHLRYIKDNLFSVVQYEVKLVSNQKRRQPAEQFLFSLKKLPCLEAKNNTLHCVGYFADHTVSIFKTFSNHFYFVSEDLYQKPEWLKFFRGLGMKTTLTFDEFKKMCEEVADGKRTNILTASKVLLSYLFSDSTKEWHLNATFLSQIGNICFVCVDQLKEFQWIKKSCQPPCYNQEQNVGLTCLNQAVIYDSSALVWTVKPVVKMPSSQVYYHQYFKHLGLTLRPCVSDVIQNLKHISETRLSNFDLFDKYDVRFDDNSTDIKIETVVEQSLKYLFEKGVATSELQCLFTIPCIPVSANKGSKEVNISQPVLVQPIQVVRFIPNECSHFFPYMHTVPLFMSSMHNLEHIGIYQDVNIKSVQHMLEMIHERLGDSELDPNYISRVREAIIKIHMLCKELSKDQLHSPETVQQLSPLYYPNIDNCLCNTKELVFIDSTRYRDAKLDFSQSSFSVFKLPSNPISSGQLGIRGSSYSGGLASESVCLQLPKEVRPKGLSLIVKEEIFVQQEVNETSPLLTHFERLKLLAQNLRTLLPQIILAYLKLEGVIINADHVNRFTSTLVDEFITSVQVSVIKDLRCQTKLLPNEEVLGTVKVPFLFQKDKDNNNYVLYVHPSANIVSYTTCKEMVHMLCIEIARIHSIPLTSYFKFISPVCECIRVGSINDLQQILDKYEINNVSIEDSVERNDTKLVLGGEIPDSLKDFLDYDINYIFHPEEWVVYEATSDYCVFAIVLYLIQGQDESNSLAKRYKIMIGEKADGTREEKEVSALDLYKFISKKKTGGLEEGPSQDMVPINSDGETAQLRKMTDSMEISELKRAIYNKLKEIWKLEDENERRKAEKRLYLAYHPDKNDPNYCHKYTEAFKYLKKQIERHDSNLPLQNPDDDEDESSVEEVIIVRTSRRREQYYRQWDHFASRQSHYRRNRSRRNYYETIYNSNVYEQFIFNYYSLQPQRDPEEAKCWLRQAKSDLEAMRVLLGTGSHTCQILFLAHEACEKALKAGKYQLVGLNEGSLKNHDLHPHASAIASVKGGQWSQLPILVIGMDIYYLHSRFPNVHGRHTAPVDVYTNFATALEMAANAGKVVGLIDLLI